MRKLKVAILGYGVIGRRVADAVRLQDDMEVIGVAGRAGSFSLRDAALQGFPVFVAHGGLGTEVTGQPGELEQLVSACDAVLDCTPSGVPKSYLQLSAHHPELVTIVQGGEEHEGTSFNAFANYSAAAGQKRVRVISCSSTGTTRLVYALDRAFGLREAFVTLVRRAADPAKRPKNSINSLLPVMGQSHHAPDVNTVMPHLKLYSMSVDVNTTFGHVIHVLADLEQKVSREDVISVLDRLPRIIVGTGLATTADLAEHFQDLGRRRRDRPEIYVWQEGVEVHDRTISVTLSVHMESITIPETVDCLRAVFGLEKENWASIYKTDLALGIAKELACYQAPKRRGGSSPDAQTGRSAQTANSRATRRNGVRGSNSKVTKARPASRPRGKGRNGVRRSNTRSSADR